MKTTIIQFTPTKNYDKNLEKLINFIKNSTSKLIIAPEVIVTDFDYSNWNEANEYAEVIKKRVLPLSKDKIIVFTMIEENKNKVYVFYNQKVVYVREKVKLFGYEKRYFKVGEIEPEIFEIDGVKFAILICFEIRFIDYWTKLRGVDVVLVPAMWGIERKNHLITLSNALALSLQSYVVVSDGLAFASGLSGPWGEEIRNQNETLDVDIDLNYIKKIRKRLTLE